MRVTERAYQEALSRIEHELVNRTGSLDLSGSGEDGISLLTTIPSEISKLTRLERLKLDGSEVTSASPIANLTSLKFLSFRNSAIIDIEAITELVELEELNLINTRVIDLRPCRSLSRLENDQLFGLRFKGTFATRIDPNLMQLSEIKGSTERSRKTLDYLNSLDDTEYDAFLARRKRELRIVEGEAVPTPPKPSPTAKARAQILAPRRALHRKVILPLADQIKTGLREWQNQTGTNQLPEALQLVEHLANGFALVVQQSDIQGLEARLAYLESEGQKLATLLKQEQAKTAALAHELSEVKTAKFAPAFREEMGKRSAQMVTAGVYAFTGLGVTYLLGEAHPITKALISVISPK